MDRWLGTHRGACATVLLSLLPLWAGWGTVEAAEGLMVPPGRQVDLVLKVLTYDQMLPQKVAGAIKIGIVFPAGGESLARDLLAEFRSRREFRVAGFAFEADLLPQDTLSAGQGWTAWLVLPGESSYLGEVARQSRKAGIMTITPCAACVGPLSLGLEAEEGKITLYRCDECLKAENIRLSAQLLKITVGR